MQDGKECRRLGKRRGRSIEGKEERIKGRENEGKEYERIIEGKLGG